MPARVDPSVPLLVAADDDWEALGALVEMLEDFDVVPVLSWPKLRDAVRRFEPDLVLMSETLRFPRVSARRMLERLTVEEKARVMILSEFSTAAASAGWRDHGAIDSILHPTKVPGRIMRLKRRILELTLPDPENVERQRP